MFDRIRYAFNKAFYQQIKQAQQESYLDGYRKGFNEGIERGFELGGGFPKQEVVYPSPWTFKSYYPPVPCPGGEDSECDVCNPQVDLDQQRPESLDWSISREVE